MTNNYCYQCKQPRQRHANPPYRGDTARDISAQKLGEIDSLVCALAIARHRKEYTIADDIQRQLQREQIEMKYGYNSNGLWFPRSKPEETNTFDESSERVFFKNENLTSLQQPQPQPQPLTLLVDLDEDELNRIEEIDALVRRREACKRKEKW